MIFREIVREKWAINQIIVFFQSKIDLWHWFLTFEQGILRCLANVEEPGIYNVTFRVQDEGDSVTSKNYQNHLNNEKLDGYNFEVYPQIRSVSPSSGSTEGGTLITIDGTGFESSFPGAGPATVTVGGKPCEIVSVEKKQIVCKTPKVENGGNPALKRKWEEIKEKWDCPGNDISYATKELILYLKFEIIMQIALLYNHGRNNKIRFFN